MTKTEKFKKFYKNSKFNIDLKNIINFENRYTVAEIAGFFLEKYKENALNTLYQILSDNNLQSSKFFGSVEEILIECHSEKNNEEYIVVERNCPICGNANRVYVNKDNFMKFLKGELVIQEACKEVPIGLREILITGIDNKCWHKLFDKTS